MGYYKNQAILQEDIEVSWVHGEKHLDNRELALAVLQHTRTDVLLSLEKYERANNLKSGEVSDTVNELCNYWIRVYDRNTKGSMVKLWDWTLRLLKR